MTLVLVCSKSALPIAQDREWQPQPLDQLPLIIRALSAQAEDSRVVGGEAVMQLGEAFEFRGRSVGAWNVVPAGRIGLTGTPGPWIDRDDTAAGKRGDAEFRPVGRGQRDLRQRRARRQVSGPAAWHGQPLSRKSRPFWRSQSRFFSVSRLS